jgi:acyl carrier protein
MNLQKRLEEVFQEVFDDERLTLTDETTAQDIPAWDSVAHINLMFSIEQAFGVQFSGNELAQLKNIGELKVFLTNKGVESSDA